MKCCVPEISWHNRDPVLSIDVQLNSESPLFYRVATGGNDSHVVVWHVKVSDRVEPDVYAVADLTHHLKPVNVVRFGPLENTTLASADDDGHIIVWRRQSPRGVGGAFGEDDDVGAAERDPSRDEHYGIWKTLRGHLQDVYDLCWSADGTQMVSGAVDSTAIIWNVQKGSCSHILRNHDSFVQGVAWDPRNRYVASLSCDRYCRLFLSQTGRCVSKLHRCKLPAVFDDDNTEKVTRLFHDDTLQTFCRRLTFTPDGSLLLTPAGVVEKAVGPPANVVHVFSRHDFSKPVYCLPTDTYTVAIRCCPRRFQLRSSEPLDPSLPPWEQTETLLKLPYRMVIAVATKVSLLLYDTQQSTPFASISNIHFTRLTDVSWSSDGLLLVASSTDGFCSLVTFEDGELGLPYVAPDRTALRQAAAARQSEAGGGEMDGGRATAAGTDSGRSTPDNGARTPVNGSCTPVAGTGKGSGTPIRTPLTASEVVNSPVAVTENGSLTPVVAVAEGGSNTPLAAKENDRRSPVATTTPRKPPDGIKTPASSKKPATGRRRKPEQTVKITSMFRGKLAVSAKKKNAVVPPVVTVTEESNDSIEWLPQDSDDTVKQKPDVPTKSSAAQTAPDSASSAAATEVVSMDCEQQPDDVDERTDIRSSEATPNPLPDDTVTPQILSNPGSSGVGATSSSCSGSVGTLVLKSSPGIVSKSARGTPRRVALIPVAK